MLAQDIRPNRLERAKLGVMDFVSQLEGDRVGLLPFSGSSFLLCPLTIDYSAFANSLDILNVNIIPKGGTDLAGTIEQAEKILANNANHKILVLLTDGENLEGDAIEAARLAAEKGMIIYTIGVGSSEGELIPLADNGKSGFIKDKSGKFVTSRLDEKTLKAIARESDGLYAQLGKKGEGLEYIYQQKLALVPKEELMEKRHKVPLERFSWPLGAALFLLLLEFLISERKSSRSFRLAFIKTAGRRKQKKTAAAFLCLLLITGLSSKSQASEGEDAFDKGDYITASKIYSEALKRHPEDPELHYNFGTTAYKNNMFDDAASSFKKTLGSEDLGLQARAYYNLGNSLYQKGKETLQTDPQHSMELWQEAIKSYQGSLALNEQNDNAAFNLDLVQKKLDELKKQEQKKKEQEKKNQDQNKQDQKQEENKSGEQEQSSESSSEQKEDKNGDQQKQEQNQEKQNSQGHEKPAEEKGTDSQTSDEEKTAAEATEPGEQTEDQEQTTSSTPRPVGSMSEEEARQLLKTFKAEEGELNFIPGARNGQNNNNVGSGRDW